MTATELPGRDPALPGRLARSLRGAALSGASVAGASAAGALVSVREAYPRPPRAAPPEGWPPPKPVPQGRLAVAVVLGASGSVITDALGPYEVFARSPEFFVYTVSDRPTAMLSGALAVVPDYSLGDVDAGAAPEPAVIVIPAVVSPAGRKERPLREWLARRAARGAQLLGVCAGSRLLAAAGLLDGHRATASITAKSIEYPTSHLRLAGPAWPWRPTTLFALTVAAAIGAGFLPAAATHRNRR